MVEAKARVVELIAGGSTNSEAMEAVGRQRKTLEVWRSKDREFAEAVDEARERFAAAKAAGRDGDLYKLSFPEFRMRFLRRHTYPHMQNITDVLEGRDPSWLDDAFTWRPANRNRVLVHVAPFHAKTQLMIDWIVYKVCMDPNVRIMVISQRAEQARKFLYQIKQRLTSNLFLELQQAYAPEGGFKGKGAEWSANRIYVAGRDSDEKDPTIEVVGMGGQIYGNRADFILLDDCVTRENAAQFEKQILWIESEVENRVFNGKIVLVGTRLAAQDLYSELQNGDRYISGESPWTLLSMPMVLREAPDPKDWVTLWPRSHQPLDPDAQAEPDADGMYAAWDGVRAEATKRAKPPSVWALVYQQQSVSEDMTFHPACVQGSVDGRRKPGPLVAGAYGHPGDGMDGMHTVLSIDPAASGEAAMLALAVNRASKDRWVLNCWKKVDSSPAWYLQMMEEICPQYRVREVIIEAQGYSAWAIHDPGIVAYCRDHGIRLRSSYTGRNKVDPDFGVAAMAPLFGSLRRTENGGRWLHAGDNVVHLPDPHHSPGVKALCDELVTWVPSKKAKNLVQDCVMALWLAEQVAREHITGGDREPTRFLSNRYLSRGAQKKRYLLPSSAGFI